MKFSFNVVKAQDGQYIGTGEAKRDNVQAVTGINVFGPTRSDVRRQLQSWKREMREVDRQRGQRRQKLF